MTLCIFVCLLAAAHCTEHQLKGTEPLASGAALSLPGSAVLTAFAHSRYLLCDNLTPASQEVAVCLAIWVSSSVIVVLCTFDCALMSDAAVNRAAAAGV